jgi:hypothetical protein
MLGGLLNRKKEKMNKWPLWIKNKKKDPSKKKINSPGAVQKGPPGAKQKIINSPGGKQIIRTR